MKNPSHSPGRCTASFAPFAALVLVVCACSSSEPLLTEQSPAVPAGPAAPAGDPTVPGETDTFGSPGAGPLSTPPEDDEPDATETNFLTPPCSNDADCGDGRRCVGGGRVVPGASSDGGAPDGGGAGDGAADGGGADGGLDAGPPSDAEFPLGRCQPAGGR